MFMENVQIRHVEFTDYPDLRRLFSHPQVYRDTLQLPLPSEEMWAKRIKDFPAGMHSLVACIDEEVVGQLTIEANQRARRKHVATFGIAVDANYCGKGIGSALGVYTDDSAQRRANKDMQAERERLQNIEQQNLILKNDNEQAQVTTFAESELGIVDDTAAASRRKKQATGGATSGLGLQV